MTCQDCPYNDDLICDLKGYQIQDDYEACEKGRAIMGYSGDAEEKLKPCPFCGGKAHIHSYFRKDRDGKRKCYVVHCEKCGVNYPEWQFCDTEKKAIEMWNKRVCE